MQSLTQTAPLSTSRLWTARLLTGLTVLFMLFDSIIHLVAPGPVVDAFAHLGFPIGFSAGIGIVELLCTLLYLIPRTSVLGAILLTAILGGAITAHIRVADPLFETYIFPALVGLLVWGGPYLRDERVRALIPIAARPPE
jgi:hypothetical protein